MFLVSQEGGVSNSHRCDFRPQNSRWTERRYESGVASPLSCFIQSSLLIFFVLVDYGLRDSTTTSVVTQAIAIGGCQLDENDNGRTRL